MLRSRARRPMPVAGWAFLIGSALPLITLSDASAQQTQQPPQQQTQQQPTRQQQQTQQRPTDDKYILGAESRLEIVVHVLGEVERPGEYRVTDETDVLELISKAGGPTRFAN